MTAQTVEFGAQLVTFYAEDVPLAERESHSWPAYYAKHREVNLDAQVKVWDALERETWRHKSRTAPFAKGASLAYGVGGVEGAYQAAMGRSWGLVDPEPDREAYGAPVWDYRTLNDRKYQGKWDAYNELRREWSESADGLRFAADLAYWQARRAQFAYTGSRKGDKELLASLVTVAVDENQAVLA